MESELCLSLKKFRRPDRKSKSKTPRSKKCSARLRACFARHVKTVRAEADGSQSAAGKNALTDTLAQWVAMHFTVAAHREAESAGDEGLPLPLLRELVTRVATLRKGDQSAARLALEHERLDLEFQKTADQMEARFERWLKTPEVQKRFHAPPMSPEERQRRIRAIFGITDPDPMLDEPTDPEPPAPSDTSP